MGHTMAPVLKYPLLKAYRDLWTQDTMAWARPDDLVKRVGIPHLEGRRAKNTAYSAYTAGHLDRHSEEPETYRINADGLRWLEATPEPDEKPGPVKPRKASGRKPEKARSKVLVEAAKAVNGEVPLGTLFEVVGKDEAGMMMARSLEDDRIYRMVKV